VVTGLGEPRREPPRAREACDTVHSTRWKVTFRSRRAQESAKPPARTAFDESLTSPSTIIPALEALPKASRFPVIARVDADRQTLEPDANGVYHFESLDARLSQYHDKQVPV